MCCQRFRTSPTTTQQCIYPGYCPIVVVGGFHTLAYNPWSTSRSKAHAVWTFLPSVAHASVAPAFTLVLVDMVVRCFQAYAYEPWCRDRSGASPRGSVSRPVFSLRSLPCCTIPPNLNKQRGKHKRMPLAHGPWLCVHPKVSDYRSPV